MRFPWSFTRFVGEGAAGIRLLSPEETAPAEKLDETGAAASLSRDNVLVSRQANTNAWPVQRVVVGWAGPQSADPEGGTNARHLDLTAFIFDHRTGFWFLMSKIQGAEERRIHVFDVPCLIDTPTVGRQGGQVSGPQALEIMIVPTPITNGRPVAKEYREGAYVFALGADVSNTP